MTFNYISFTLIVLAIIFNISSISAQVNIEENIQGTSKIEVYFTNQLKFDDLISIRETLAEQRIVLEFKKLQFDEFGNLEAIDFIVDSGDGFSGSASISDLSYRKTFGFRRNYYAEIYPFEIGQIK